MLRTCHLEQMFTVAKSPNVAIDSRIARIFKEKCADFKMFLISTFNWRSHAGDKKKNNPPMEHPWRQTPRLSHTSRWLHTGDSTCFLMQGQGAALLLWLLSSLGLCRCLTSILTHVGHMLQACFTLVLMSEPFCCFRNSCDSSPHPHTFPAHLRPLSPGVILMNAGVPHGPWGCDAIFLSSIPVLFKSELARVPWGFPGGSVVKNLPVNAGNLDLIPGSGRSPREGNGNPLQYSCLGNPMDRGARWASPWGHKKSRTRLSD